MKAPFIRIVTLAVMLGLASSGQQCWAVVVAVGDGSGNTTAPADDPGFENVGSRGIGSAVYLGNRWVLTAAHIGAGTTEFLGVDYQHDPASVQQVKNPDGSTPVTDMVMYRLTEAPPLPRLRLSCSSPKLGSQVTLIGSGLDRATDPTYWDVQRKAGPGNDVWSEVSSPTGADRTGYATQTTQTTRWGDNMVSLVNLDVTSQRGDNVKSFQTSFEKDSRFATPNEAQGVRGDSGGGVFAKDSGFWHLNGLIHAISLHDNQPNGIRTAVYGNSTFVADLTFYADELRAIGDFEPLPGDMDGNDQWTAEDADALSISIVFENHACATDLNGDGLTNADDMTRLLQSAEALPGDTNLDGSVDFQDFLRVAQSFDTAGFWSNGDFTLDGKIDFADFLILGQHFGREFGQVAGQSVQAAAVPEPTTAVMLASTILALGLRRRRR